MRKWGVLGAAILTHLCLGGIYAWSAFVPPLRETFGFSAAQTQLVFGTCIGTLTLVGIFAGRIQDRFGPRGVCSAGALFVASAYGLASWQGGRFPILWLGMGVLNGVGVGCGYLAAIATAVKWFPQRKGLAAGAVVAGYGASAIVLSNLVQFLLSHGWPVLHIFRLVAAVYGSLLVVCAQFLVLPEPTGSLPPPALPLRTLFQDRRFWALAVAMFCATIPGLAIIGLLKPIGLWFGLAAGTTTLAITALAIGNGGGRVAWGYLSDRMGSHRALLCCMALVVLSAVLFQLSGRSPAGFLASAFFLGFCYGGSLAIFPARTADLYGPAVMGSVYPLILFTHGIAAIGGAPLAGRAFDLTVSHHPAITGAAAVALAGLAAYALLMRRGIAGSAIPGPLS